jgi:hypothetical protein
MQLRRCITWGFRNYSQGASFNLLWVWVITVERVLEMSGFPSIARTVADPSTLSPHQAEQLLETLLWGLRLPSRVVRIVSSLALTARRLVLTPLALSTHVTLLTLTFHLSHSPLTSHSHSPLTRTHLSLLTRTAPPNPQPATQLLRTRNTFEPATPRGRFSLAPPFLDPFVRRSPPNPQRRKPRFSAYKASSR